MRSLYLVVGLGCLVGCGDAFSSAAGGDADAATNPDAATDASEHDAAIGDSSDHDADTPDATEGDAIASDAEQGGDANGCSVQTPCPTGFLCTAGACVDRAAVHFSATSNPNGNWSYGSATTEGAAFVAYTVHGQTDPSLDVWSTIASSLAPSVFHNSAVTSTTYSQGFVMAGSSLGLAPTPPIAGEPGPVSIVRFTAPVSGNYAIFATFSGLVSNGGTTVSASVLINESSGAASGGFINSFSAGNTFTYSTSSVALTAGTNVDFIVEAVETSMWMSGYTGLDARITAL